MGEVFYQGNLDDKQREFITRVVLATNQTLPQLKANVGAALNVRLTPIKITALRTKYNHLKNNKFRWQKHEDK
ncbi:carboxymuconolactone decarboxylase family protein [Heyndrickxia ginsengihumi]|uniref:carboxymuconolactone decarboxylase family protein n=1 Tax=Heyndrickxia ginsengihumi TaxID=363870 RepID=UPI003D1B16C4